MIFLDALECVGKERSMLRMDQVHVIRHQYYVEGLSIRTIARRLQVNRRTVRKYLLQAEPQRQERRGRAQPVQASVGPRIEALLEEWSERLVGKHRLTATRLHRQLREEGWAIGERTVRRYLAERRRRQAEVYVPLVHRPGEEGQVDFFAVTVEVAGARRQVWKFLLRLMYSGRDFVWLYDRCDQLSFLDGHVRAFAHFEGVVRRLVYDNLTAAVKRLVGLAERELTGRFQALSSHYLFEPCFARPGEGHDKGGVEARGKGVRLQHLTPIVSGPDLGTLSAALLTEVEQGWAGRCQADGRPLPALFEEERRGWLPLPPTAFDARALMLVSVSRSATVTVAGARYSLPERWARLEAEAWVGVADVCFRCQGETVVRPRGRRGEQRIEYRDYLRSLSRKPQAVRQVAPELLAELGEPYRRLWGLLEQSHGPRQAARLLAGVLGAVHDHGEVAVTAALNEALAAGSFDREGSGNLLALTRQLPALRVLTDSAVPARLRTVAVETGSAADYDQLLWAATAAGGAR
jgi:transposase